MGLMETIKADIEQITGDSNEFGQSLSFRATTGETAEIIGIYSDHSNDYNSEGVSITGKFTHVTISEKYLTDQNYPTRNNEGLLNMIGHLVTVNYADGTSKRYMIDEARPDYTVNLLTLILSNYNGSN